MKLGVPYLIVRVVNSCWRVMYKEQSESDQFSWMYQIPQPWNDPFKLVSDVTQPANLSNKHDVLGWFDSTRSAQFI